MPLPIRSFKLHLLERHVRIVPSRDAAGCPFAGPGVTLRGEDADRMFAAAAPLLAGIEAFEPGISIRSLSVNLEARRILATLRPTVPEADARPRVVRLDGPPVEVLMAGARALVEALGAAAAEVLGRRSPR